MQILLRQFTLQARVCIGSKVKFRRDNILPPSLSARYDYYQYLRYRKTVNPG